MVAEPQPQESRSKLYAGLRDKGLYTKSEDEFNIQFADPASRQKLFDGLVAKGLYTKAFDDFDGQFFSDLKKKDFSADFSPQLGKPGEPSAPLGPLDGHQLVTQAPTQPVNPLGLVEDTVPPPTGITLSPEQQADFTAAVAPPVDNKFQQDFQKTQAGEIRQMLGIDPQSRAIRDELGTLKEGNPLTSVGKSLWNTLSNDIPSALAALGTMAMHELRQGGMGYPESPPVGVDLTGQVNNAQGKEMTLVEKELLKFANKAQFESAETRDQLVSQIKDVKDPLDALNWVSATIGQAAGQIPLAVLSGGGTSIAQEVGSIYLETVNRIAQEKKLSPEQVISQGLDSPASALAFGTAAGILDYVGAKGVISSARKGFADALRKRAVAMIKAGAIEGGTEYTQTFLEQIGQAIGAGGSISEVGSAKNGDERLEALAAGIVGGAGVHAITGAAENAIEKIKPKTKSNVKPKEEPVPGPADTGGAAAVQGGGRGADGGVPENTPKETLPVQGEEKVDLDPAEVQKRMKPIVEQMIDVEDKLKTAGYDIEGDYDSETIITDSEGEIVMPEALPDDLRKLAAQYEQAQKGLGEFSEQDLQKVKNEVRKSRETSVEVVASEQTKEDYHKFAGKKPPEGPPPASTGIKETTGRKVEPHKEVKANKSIAIKEVAPRFKLKEMEAGMLHGLRGKEIARVDYFDDNGRPSGLKGQMLKKLEDAGYVEQLSSGEKLSKQTDSDYILTDKAKEFIDAVDARAQTRRQVKAGVDMFPEDAGIPEFKPVLEDLKDKTDENTINDFKQRTDKQIEESESTVQDIERKAESTSETELNEVVEEADRVIGDYRMSHKVAAKPATKPADADPADKVVKQISEAIGTNKLDKRAIEKIGAEHGITDKNEVKELAELAVVQKARELAKADDFAGLMKLYEDQPNLTHRTNESISKQQYSTPAPLGYLMGKYIGAEQKGKQILEPSAGNGLLTIVGDPKAYTVNEIDQTRLRNLHTQGFKEVLSQDGSKDFDRPDQFDAVITNPPFGGVPAQEIDGYKFNELAQIMAVKGLDAMKGDGKAAIIIGGNNKYDEQGRLTGRDRIFFNYLYSHYNVEDVIDVSGDIYHKQGASFPIRVILVKGRKATAEGVAPLKAAFGERETTFEGIQKRIQNPRKHENIQPTQLVGGPTKGADRPGARPNPEVNQPPAPAVPDGPIPSSGRKGDTGKVGGKPGSVRSGDTPGQPASQQPTGDSRRGPEQRPVPEPTDGEGSTERTESEQSEGTPADTGPRVKRDRQVAERVQSGESTVDYKPSSSGKSLGAVKAPASLQQEMLDALTDLENEVGNVDEFVQKKLGYKSKEELHKALGAEQVDAVALAIRNVERGTAIIIGDQPGLGKGRQAAAMVRYANQQGLVPIFLTKGPNLFSDFYRDLFGIGHGQVKPFIINNGDAKFRGISHGGQIIYKAPAQGSQEHRRAIREMDLPAGTGMIMATYSQFNSGKDTPKKLFIAERAKGTIIILDEAHLASGEESNTNAAFTEFLQNAKGVVYLSGTYAKRASNIPLYALKTSMSEATMTPDEMVEAIKKGGNPLLEINASILTQTGEMVRRERTFKGIEVNTHLIGGDNAAVKEKQLKQSDQVTEVMRDIIRFQEVFVNPVVKVMDGAKKGGRVGGRKGAQMGGVKNSPYFQKVFNVINQLLYSIKAQETADLMIKELQAGRKPFLAIRSTMESMLKDIVERGDLNVGDPINADFSFVIKKGLEGVMRITEEDDKGVKTYTTIKVSDLTPLGQQEHKRLSAKIAGLKTGLTISPIDQIVETLTKAGYKVGEVTGRQLKVHFAEGKALLDHNKRLPVNDYYDKFNAGDIDVLIVNRSGSTGSSAHADANFKDQRPRTMFVLETELDISELVQILYRVNRTGQVVPPKYVFITSSIPAEQRIMMMTMRKLKSLDANTTSNQKQSNALIEVPEIFNKYGDQVVMEYLRDNPEIDAEIGYPLETSTNDAGEEVAQEGTANTVTGKIAVLSTDKQAAFYNEIAERYTKYIAFLNEAGMNDLIVENLPLNATTLSKNMTIMGKGGRSKFGDDTFLEEAEVDVLKKPMTKAEIDNQMKELGGDRNAEFKEAVKKYRETAEASIQEKGAKDLAEQVEKIEKSELPDEEKAAKIEEATADNQFKTNSKLEKAVDKIQYVESLFNFYTPGRAVKIPIDYNDLFGSGYRDAIFLGFDIDLSNKKAFLPSNVVLRFAVNDARRTLTLPASRQPLVRAIREASYQLSEEHKEQTLKEWDNLKKPKAREKRHIVTGNILQGLSKDEYRKGAIVKYSTSDGFINTGVLLPESFDPAEDGTPGEISVPAGRAADAILKAKVGTAFTSGDGTVTVYKNSPEGYTIGVPKSKAMGGKYFEDAEVNTLVDRGRWDSLGSQLVSKTDASRLKPLLELLSKKFGTSFVLKKGDTPKDVAVTKGGVNPALSFPQSGKAPATKAQPGVPFNMAERVKAIFKSFNIPINEGALRLAYDGVYKYFTQGVRVQAMWDMYVAAHEGMHAFDERSHIHENIKKYGSQKLKSELLDAYDNLYPTPKSTASMAERIQEGLAVLASYHLADPVMTGQRFPETVKHVFRDGGQFYKEEVGQFLSKMEALAAEYFVLKPQDKINARIKWGGTDAKRGLGFLTKVNLQLFNDLTTGEIVDNMLGGVYRASAIIPNVTMLRNIGSIVSNWVKHPFGASSKPQTYRGNGQWGPTSSGYRVADYMNLFRDGTELMEFNTMLVARRQYQDYLRAEKMALEIEDLEQDDPKNPLLPKLKEEHEKLKALLENNKIPEAEASATLQSLGSKYDKATEIYDALNGDMLDFMEATELITTEKADEFRNRSGYAAFQRFLEDEHLSDIDALNLSGGTKSSVKALRAYGGSALQIIPPTYSQVLAINETLTKGQRNLVWKAWAEAARKNVEVAQFFELVTKIDVDVHDKNIQTVYHKGVRKYYKMGEEARLFGEALTPTQIDVLSEVMRGFARLFQTGTTAAYPLYGMINVTMDAWVRMAQTKTGLIPVISDLPTVGKTLMGMVNWLFKLNSDNEFTDFMALGGRRSSYAASQIVDADASLGQMLNKGWWSKTKRVGEIGLQLAELPTNFTELVGRGTEYIRAVEQGHPSNVAMLMAANVSVNFANKGKFGGKVGQELVKWVAYMGASIQALNQFVKTAKSDPKRVGSVVAFATVITAMGSLITYLVGDDDEKEMLADQLPEDYARWIYLPRSVFGGKPGLVRFRMPEQIGVAGGMTQLYFANLFKNQPLVFEDIYKVLEAPLPQQIHLSQGPGMLMSAIPTAIAPEVQTMTNTRFYPELLPIVPPNLQDYAEWRQYDKYSSRAARAVGDMTADNLQISPKKFDFYVRAKFGRATQLVQSIAEAVIYGDEVKAYNPMWQEYDRTAFTGRIYNRFWDIRAEANQTAKSLNLRNTKGQSPRLWAKAELKAATLNFKAKLLMMALDDVANGKELPDEKKRELFNMIQQVVKEEDGELP